MLTTIRKKATGLISLILIGAICLSFALWGVQSYFEGATEVDVARVNGEKISYEFFQAQLRARQEQMRQVFQNQLPANYYESDEFKRQTIDQIIDSVIIKQITDKNKYTMDDDSLTERIKSNPTFQDNDEFDNDRYRRLLASNNWSVKAYEETQRKQGAFEKVNVAVNESVMVDDAELDRILGLRNQKRFSDYLILEQKDFTAQITDEQIQQHYEENLATYQTADQIKIDYIELSAKDLIAQGQPSKEVIAQYFEDHQAKFITPEIRKASHILIKPAADDEASNAEATAQVNQLIDKLNNGADFGELAKEFSHDKGSANNGGDLGVITKGVMSKPFEDAVFTLQEGQLSEPIESKFGYHLIKLTELTPGRAPKIEDIEDRLVEEYKNDQAINEFTELAENFKNLVFENPQDLKQVADTLGLQIKYSDWFSRNTTTGIAANQQVKQAAFSDSVINDDLNSEVIELEENKLIALRKNDFKPSTARPLDEVKDRISTLLSSQTSLQLTHEKGKSLLDKLDEIDWDLMVSDGGFTVEELAQTQSAAKPGNEAAISKIVFEQAMPEPDKPIYGGVVLPQGYAVYRLKGIENPDKSTLEAIPEEDREQLRATLSARYGRENSTNILKTHREIADIRLFEENW